MGRETIATLTSKLKTVNSLYENLKKSHNELITKEAKTEADNKNLRKAICDWQKEYDLVKDDRNYLLMDNRNMKIKYEGKDKTGTENPFSDEKINERQPKEKPLGFCIGMAELDRLTKPMPSIQKFIMVEKMKGQEFSMKTFRGEIVTDNPNARIAGERASIGEIVSEMTSSTAAMLENHIAGAAMKIEVIVTEL